MEIKKKEILDRATEVIMRYGIKSVTMDDLARELSISKKTLYALYGDKRRMIQTLVSEQIQADKNSCLTKITLAKDAIEEMFLVSTFVSERLKKVNVTFFYDLRMRYPKAFQAMENYKWGFVQGIIIQNLTRGMREGIYREDLHPKIVARIYLTNIEMIFGGGEFDNMNINAFDVFQEIFILHMRGIVNDKGLPLLINHLKNVTKS